MEDISKALVMAGCVLLFVFATSVSVYCYSKVIENTKGWAIFSYSDARTEQTDTKTGTFVRPIEKAEVIATILQFDELGLNKIKIGDREIAEASISGVTINDGDKYTSSYDEGSKVLIYSLVEE